MNLDWNRPPMPSGLLVIAAILLTTAINGAGQQNSTAVAQTQFSLELRFGGGRTQFHRGEIIPVELTYTPVGHSYESLTPPNCYPPSEFEYRVDPPNFGDRSSETDAAQGMEISVCSGPMVTAYTGETPFKLDELLNKRFRMDVPGKYRITATYHGVALPVTSKSVDLEILPDDPAWQKAELERALTLMRHPSDVQENDEGCRILRFLGTDDAEIAAARLYNGMSNCDMALAATLISARNRKAVLGQLEAGLKESQRPISESYLRTIAIVSLYQQHPDWYPPEALATELKQAKRRSGYAEPSELWRERGTLLNRELYYAKMLATALPGKVPEARAKSLETFIYLGRTLGYVEIPAELVSVSRNEMPSMFRSLLPSDQNYVLRHGWPEIESPAMMRVLKQVVEVGFEPASRCPQNIALRRLYELSPQEARPYILSQLHAEVPCIETSVLALLPEKELPELDAIMLNRVQRSQDDGYRVTATALVQRYASAAIAKDLRPFMIQNIGNMTCESEANLLAYYLRVTPEDGKEMLRKAMQEHGRLSCRENLLQRLATIRMSAEIEDAAVAALDDPDPAVVEEGLRLVEDCGSVNSRAAILRAFRRWHQEWQPRLKELGTPANAGWAQLESDYFAAAAFAHAWLVSKEDLQALADLCLTESCKQGAASVEIGRAEKYVMIAVREPIGDEIAEQFLPGGTMDRLKEKMAQYPKGTLFQIDARFEEYTAVQRIFNELSPWTADHGYVLRIYD